LVVVTRLTDFNESVNRDPGTQFFVKIEKEKRKGKDGLLSLSFFFFFFFF